MADRRSALPPTGPRSDRAAPASGKPQIFIHERHPLEIVQVAAYDASGALGQRLGAIIGAPFETRPNSVRKFGDTEILWSGAGRWTVVRPATAPDGALAQELRSGLDGIAAVVDLSHARTVFRMRGAVARTVLAGGVAVDLHQTKFKPGDCMLTGIGKIAATIACVDEAPQFDVYVYRSYGESVREWLREAAWDCELIEEAPRP